MNINLIDKIITWRNEQQILFHEFEVSMMIIQVFLI